MTEYEEGVAEILVEKFDGRGTVERDAKRPSRSYEPSGTGEET